LLCNTERFYLFDIETARKGPLNNCSHRITVIVGYPTEKRNHRGREQREIIQNLHDLLDPLLIGLGKALEHIAGYLEMLEGNKDALSNGGL
jgi:hypothetical protein